MNEVGGDPDCDGFSLEHFHAYNQKMQASFPDTMITLSTHDSKRADDVRARMLVLSEIPDAFGQAARRWSRENQKHRSGRKMKDQIDTGTEWFLYQTLVGAWPIPADRLREYMQKAMREAKVRTSWVANNANYEGALNKYIDAVLGDKEFVADLQKFVGEIEAAGRVNSLAQTLLKYTAPGVPDLYQGGELWDFSLVDPDNRRPVDYARRRELLMEMKGMSAAQVMERIEDGLPKLWVIHRALRLRNEHPEWFGAKAEYAPVYAEGAQSERVIAYMRGGKVLTIAPRWSQGAVWDETAIEVPEGRWEDCLTGRSVAGGRMRVGDLLRAFPVSLLVREG
jgi:(1->4)-alpha-D-glucan 1-alpha-D-glucosylmutase